MEEKTTEEMSEELLENFEEDKDFSNVVIKS